MSAAPVTENAARRRIGDILLAHGFVSEAELTEAAAEQERTGQPLGQILVQQGVITRLELASALAEQWSDQSVSISLLPVPKPAPRPAQQHHDDDQYAARLQDAVADLARRVHVAQPSDADDERITDLAERIEATVARSQRIEATLATLADSLEGVTGGVEEAFTGLQSGMAGLALDLARIDSTVAEIVARPVQAPSSDPALEERLEELAASVQGLAERPVGDDATRRDVDELAARLETLVDDAGLDDLRGRLRDVQAQVDGLAGGAPALAELERQAEFLNDLRVTVVDLEARPVGSPEIDARLERIESNLAEQLATVPGAGTVEALATRVETALDRQERFSESVEELAARLDEIATLTGRDDDTRARVDDLESRLADGAATLVELRRELSDRPEPPSARKLEKFGDALDTLKRDISSLAGAKLDDRIEKLARRVEEVAADRGAYEVLAGRLEALEGRLPSDLVTGADLSRAVAGVRDELGSMAPEQNVRIEQLAHALDSVRTDLARTREELATATPGPDERVDRLTHDLDAVRAELAAATPEPDNRVDQIIAELASVRAELARTREELATATPGADERVDRLTHDLDAVRAELARTATLATPAPELASRLELLAGRFEELAVEHGRHAALEVELRAVEQRLSSGLVSSSDFERVVAEIRGELERAPVTPPGSPGTEQAVALLEERLGALEALSAKVEELAGAAAAVPAGADDLRREVEQRLEALARTVEDRLAAAGSAPRAAVEAPVGLEDELERTRMAIERVGLHLGEHDRALAEMRGSRAFAQRLDELAARIDDLAASGVSAPSGQPGSGESSYLRRSLEPDLEMRSLIRRLEDVEEAAHAGREKLMTRLERMASSIDWRLQRLEAGDTE